VKKMAATLLTKGKTDSKAAAELRRKQFSATFTQSGGYVPTRKLVWSVLQLFCFVF
jgi:hypothetical protein